MDFPIYFYKDYMTDRFPFKIEVKTERRYNWRLHAHEHLQLCYVMSGSCYHWIENKRFLLVKGDIISIPPFLEHRMELMNEKPFEIIQIDFMPFFINENLRDLSQVNNFVDFAYIQPLVSRDGVVPKMAFPPHHQTQIEELIGQIRKEWDTKEEGYELAIKAGLLRLLVITVREYRKFREGRQDNQKIISHRQAFFTAIDYIEKNYHEEIRLETTAEMAQMSPSYFSSMLKTIKGRTFVEYITYVRIQNSIKLLISTDLQIIDIGLQSGFNNIGHFNKMFKRFTGVTPSEYRKQALNTIPPIA